MLNLKRAISAGAVGVASGATNGGFVTPLRIGSTSIQWATVVEGVAAVGGMAMQMFMPMIMPEIVDGMVDGGVALLAKRGTELALTSSTRMPVAPQLAAAQMNPLLGAGQFAIPQMNRAAIGGAGNVTRQKIY